MCSGTESLQPLIWRTGFTSADTSVMRLCEADFPRQAQDGEMLVIPVKPGILSVSDLILSAIQNYFKTCIKSAHL